MSKDTNGVEIKVGDTVMRVHNRNIWNADDGTEFYFRVGDTLEVAEIREDGFVRVEGHEKGWNSPDYLEIVPQQKTFNPQIGDIIVTQDRGNYTCANYCEYVEENGICYNEIYAQKPICGVSVTGFCVWDYDGKAVLDAYNIEKVIPAQKPEIKITAEISQESKIKILELENAMLRMLLRKEGVDV